MIDTIRRVNTPEGVELELRTAGLYSRAGAFLLDVFVAVLGLVMVGIVLAMGGAAGEGVFAIPVSRWGRS